MNNEWVDKRPVLRFFAVLLPVILGNLLAILILYLGCVPFGAFIFWHILHMQIGLNMGTLIFFMILLYAVLITYTLIASVIYFLKHKYQSSLLLAFLPMTIAVIILLFLSI